MDTSALSRTVIPCPDDGPTAQRDVYQAPTLEAPSNIGKEYPMADHPASAADGHHPHTVLEPGSIRTLNTRNSGPKFFHLHGRRYGTRPCGREP
ncbi:hypothetical protein [Streptomyces sp. NPDC093094]|uniref:hypothetical protein n=1 Tax=Streptomyces sp. NPDC093094 TaxID=3366026 RepID=UPI00382D1F7E